MDLVRVQDGARLDVALQSPSFPTGMSIFPTGSRIAVNGRGGAEILCAP